MNPAAGLCYVSSACAGLVALGSLVRSRRTAVDWIFSCGLAILAAEEIFSGLTATGGTWSRIEYWQTWQVTAAAALPGPWFLFSLTYARGNFRTFVRKWRAVLVGTFVLPLGLVLAFPGDLFGPMQLDPNVERWNLRLAWAGVSLYTVIAIGSVLILMNLERTFRAAVGTMRWKIKFMLLGVGLLFVVRIYTASQVIVFRGIDPNLAAMNAGILIAATGMMVISLARTGRLELDVHPSQLVLQGSITVLLAGIYLLVVGTLAKFATYVGGDTGFPLKAFVILASVAALAIVLQSDRARMQLRRFVSRNFNRPLYDYRMAWGKFTASTVSQVEEAVLSRSLVRLIADIFQALSVSIWLFDSRGESLVLGASTSQTEAQGRELDPGKEKARMIASHLGRQTEPIDIESSKNAWITALRAMHPSQFPNGGDRVCVPLIGRGELIGLLLVGDRVGGAPFEIQDFDMLKCVADHSAASILNVHLSKKLVESKELEAFQSMAAFFVHDLKNAASTLNLMLQNLPEHFHDPAFREDALRGVSKTVTHINQLISKLGMVRHELKIKTVQTDLRELVDRSLAGLGESAGSKVTRQLQSVPPVAIDPDQIQKVLTNLVLNSIEAGATKVEVLTSQSDGWAIVSVIDNGEGMSADFVNRSLFRPFQTTKKSGLGIGMFQSRMIVEAHRGRLAVASEQGKGTTFQVHLPLVPAGALEIATPL